MTQQTSDWRSLAEEASIEMDSDKLNELVEELNQALDANARSRKADHFQSPLTA